jgi:excisionase family DNA binding protein
MLTTSEAAAILGCDRTTVWRMARDARLPFVLVGNRRRFDPVIVTVLAATGRVPIRV